MSFANNICASIEYNHKTYTHRATVFCSTNKTPEIQPNKENFFFLFSKIIPSSASINRLNSIETQQCIQSNDIHVRKARNHHRLRNHTQIHNTIILNKFESVWTIKENCEFLSKKLAYNFCKEKNFVKRKIERERKREKEKDNGRQNCDELCTVLSFIDHRLSMQLQSIKPPAT